MKRETKEGLEVFRKRQEELNKASRGESGLEISAAVTDDEWTTAAKKRKRGKEGALKGVKVRKSSTGDSAAAGKQVGAVEEPAVEAANAKAEAQKGNTLVANLQKDADAASHTVPATEKQPAKPIPDKRVETKSALGLVDYGSDEDDDW